MITTVFVNEQKIKRMFSERFSQFSFFAMYFLNITFLAHNFMWWAKLAFVMVTVLVTLMNALNQWYQLKQNYKTYWFIIRIDHVFRFMKKGKIKHIKNYRALKKQLTNDNSDPTP